MNKIGIIVKGSQEVLIKSCTDRKIPLERIKFEICKDNVSSAYIECSREEYLGHVGDLKYSEVIFNWYNETDYRNVIKDRGYPDGSLLFWVPVSKSIFKGDKN